MESGDVRQTVGFNVRRLRVAAGLTQDSLAGSTGLSAVYISGIESGRRNPSAVVMSELAHALGIDVRELLSVRPKMS